MAVQMDVRADQKTANAFGESVTALCFGRRLSAPSAVQNRHCRSDQSSYVVRAGRNYQGIRRLRKLSESLNVLLSYLEVGGFHAAFIADRFTHGAHRSGVGLGDHANRGPFALGAVDGALFFPLRLKNGSLTLAIGDIDLLLALALGFRNQRALLPLGSDLRLHGAQNGFRRCQALDFVAQHLDAPVAPRLVELGDDVAIDVLARFERLVELHLADHATQRGLGELADRRDVVRRAIGREARIRYLVVKNAVDRELGIVFSNASLLGNIERHLLERVRVRNSVEERDYEVESRLQDLVEATKPLNNVCELLRNDPHALDDESDHHTKEQDPSGKNPHSWNRVSRDREDGDDDQLAEHRYPSLGNECSRRRSSGAGQVRRAALR